LTSLRKDREQGRHLEGNGRDRDGTVRSSMRPHAAKDRLLDLAFPSL
jgi:hypothetical protein